ncbi:MAG TPA: hypothetical protein VIG51_09425 [Candidatus Baltobacteraceae bacterium]|jgi:hypothetical protein
MSSTDGLPLLTDANGLPSPCYDCASREYERGHRWIGAHAPLEIVPMAASAQTERNIQLCEACYSKRRRSAGKPDAT